MTERTSLRWRAKMAKRLVKTYDTMDGQQPDNNGKERRGLLCGARLMDAVAAIAVGASLLSYQLETGFLVRAAAICTVFVGPYAAYQNRKLVKLPTLRRTQNELRQQHNVVQAQNIRLHQTAGRLQDQAQRAKQVEYDLMRIGNYSKQKVKRLVTLVNEQAKINAQIKEKLKAATVQNMISVVVKSDKNQDFKLSPTEVEILIVRIGMMEGVRLNEKEFRRRMAADPDHSLKTIMGMIRSLIDEDNPDGDEVFTLCPEQLISNNKTKTSSSRR